VLGYDYPILGLFWTFMYFFLWIVWIILLFRVFADIFRSHDMGGWAKALWTIFVVITPFLGILVYLVVRGRSMTERDVQHAQARDAAYKSYVQQTVGTSGGTADELSKLADLKAQGVLTEAEFAQEKAKLLA
jgi:heme exporter protein D